MRPGLARAYLALFQRDAAAAARPTLAGVKELAAARMHLRGVLKQAQVL